MGAEMQDHAALLSMLTGPTSSLVLLLGMLVAVWRTLVPAVKAWVDKHLTQVDSLLEQHEKDREAWLQSMRECHDRNDILLGNLERIERKVGGLYARLPQDQAG